jgi:hypothetical protein
MLHLGIAMSAREVTAHDLRYLPYLTLPYIQYLNSNTMMELIRARPSPPLQSSDAPKPPIPIPTPGDQHLSAIVSALVI